MPLVSVVTSSPHEPFEVRIAADIYTVVTNSQVTTFVDKERLAAFIAAVQAADASAVVRSRPE